MILAHITEAASSTKLETPPAFLLPAPPALFSTRQGSRIAGTICIQDVQCFPRLQASQPPPFCHVLSVKLGTKGIWGPAAWLLPPVFTAGEGKHDCSVSERIGVTAAPEAGLDCCTLEKPWHEQLEWDAVLCGGSHCARLSN